MAETKANEERDSISGSKNEHTPPPSSPSYPGKRKSPQTDNPLSNCHSCRRHFPPKPQTLTSLRTLDSEWRIVLLCNSCHCSIKSASRCPFCFSSDFSNSQSLNCRQCSHRIHLDCVPSQQHLISPNLLNSESYICLDCCAIPRFGGGKPKSLNFSRASVEELVMEARKKKAVAVRAKEKALEKMVGAKFAAEKAKDALGVVSIVEVDPVVKDEELALQLHLAMNGSQRISRSGRAVSLSGSGGRKRRRKVEVCTEDKGFLDSWSSSGCGGGSRSLEVAVKEEEGSCEDKVVNLGEDNVTIAQMIAYQRRKLKGVGSRESSSESKVELICACVEENNSLSESEQKSSFGSPDRYAKKYSKRKASLKKVVKEESQLVTHWQTSCLQVSILPDVSFSSLSGCQS